MAKRRGTATPRGEPDPTDPAIRRRAAQRAILENVKADSPAFKRHLDRLERVGSDSEARAKAYERTIIECGLKPVYTALIPWAVELRCSTLAAPNASRI